MYLRSKFCGWSGEFSHALTQNERASFQLAAVFVMCSNAALLAALGNATVGFLLTGSLMLMWFVRVLFQDIVLLMAKIQPVVSFWNAINLFLISWIQCRIFMCKSTQRLTNISWMRPIVSYFAQLTFKLSLIHLGNILVTFWWALWKTWYTLSYTQGYKRGCIVSGEYWVLLQLKQGLYLPLTCLRYIFVNYFVLLIRSAPNDLLILYIHIIMTNKICTYSGHYTFFWHFVI